MYVTKYYIAWGGTDDFMLGGPTAATGAPGATRDARHTGATRGPHGTHTGTGPHGDHTTCTREHGT